jgi:iron complex transport system permease protein
VTVDQYGIKSDLMKMLMISSFYRTYTWADVVAVAVPIALCFIVIMRYRQRMMVLAFGNEEARSMGVDTRRTQYLVVGLCTLLTAIIVSFCGHIGFVGFLIPHLARRLVGPNYKYLLPAAVALGSAFSLTAYVLVSALLGPDYETMSGMFISIFGAAVFLVTAIRGQGAESRGL